MYHKTNQTGDFAIAVQALIRTYSDHLTEMTQCVIKLVVGLHR